MFKTHIVNTRLHRVSTRYTRTLVLELKSKYKPAVSPRSYQRIDFLAVYVLNFEFLHFEIKFVDIFLSILKYNTWF